MLKFVEFLKKRPKDSTIRTIRVGYALALASLLFFASAEYSLPYAASLGEPNATYLKYALTVIVLIPGIVAAFGWCVAKRKTVRLAQIAGAVFLFVLAGAISPVEPLKYAENPESASSTISASELARNSKTEETPINVAGWIGWLAILPLLSGITGKMVTEKCLKYGEVIKKIRV